MQAAAVTTLQVTGAGSLATSETSSAFQGFPSAPCRAPSPDSASGCCSQPPAAWLREVCLRCRSRTGLAGLAAALLRAGEQPSRSLSGVRWNQCSFHKTVPMQQRFLTKRPLVAGKSLEPWRGAVCCIPRVWCARLAAWEGVPSQVPAVGSEPLFSSRPHFFMCILYTKQFQAACSGAAA